MSHFRLVKLILLLVFMFAATPQVFAYTQVSSEGVSHVCALKNIGSPTCWGDNYGQFADSTVQLNEIGVGWSHTCALKKEGTALSLYGGVICWGDNSKGQVTAPVGTFRGISVGSYHNCALKSGGTAVCWGGNENGKSTPPAGGVFFQVSAGNATTCAVAANKDTVCWGSNSNGQSTPPVSTLGQTTQVSAGGYHSCALKTDGKVVCWGDNSKGQSTPPADTFKQISAGWFHTCALKNDGNAICWGDNSAGQSSPPAGVFKQISTASLNTCALATDNSVVCWGSKSTGQGKSEVPIDNTIKPSGIVQQPLLSYPLTVNASGSGKVIGGGSYAPSLIVNLTATADAGWSFTGWTPATCQNSFTMPSSALTCTANFSQNPVLTILLNGHGSVISAGSYASGAAVTLTATADAGWSFTGWTPATCQNKFTMPASDLTCTANFSQNPVVVTPSKFFLFVTTNNNNGTVTGGGSYAAGTPVTLTATPNAGWNFAGWTPSTCQNNFTMPSSMLNCTANFSLNPATTTTPSGLVLTVNTNGNGKVTGGGSYASGAAVALTATPDAGWSFTGWTPATCQNRFNMPTSNLTCTANFSLNPATTTTPSGLVLTVNTNGNGKVTGGGSYASGAAVALTATPDAGWSFTGWTPATCQNKFTMPTSNLTCTANFSLNPVANTDKSINIAFKGIQPRYKVGDKIKIDFDMNIKMASRFERVDLWIAVQFPDRHFLFFDQFGNPVVDPKLFKADINQLTSTQTLIDFEVPPNMEGTYTFYAVCVNKGKNPLPEPSGDGESVRCSDVIMGTTTLDK